MSRLEKIKNEKILKKKYKSVCRKIFMLTMILLTVSSIFLIDYRINKILDNDSKNNLMKYLKIYFMFINNIRVYKL
ncbi:MAG: hypothetical protein U0N84_13065 [Terrisporobacter sp.]|uniref:hypothetical protein n=1 Tax=Terrisporobacter sp. TaxID=1965305 RepID=UPI0025FCC102|nr:hypothetical protein [uncultured Terrisporobacter sp.]